MNIEEIIQRTVDKKEKPKKALELSIEEAKKLKMACNNVFSSADGIVVARAFMRFCGLYGSKKNNNNLFEIGKERGKEEVYLFFFKSMLDNELINEIETKLKKEKVDA